VVVVTEPATPQFAVSEAAEGDGGGGDGSLSSAFKRAASHPEFQSALLEAPVHVSAKTEVPFALAPTPTLYP
jgi:hypothetical protein